MLNIKLNGVDNASNSEFKLLTALVVWFFAGKFDNECSNVDLNLLEFLQEFTFSSFTLTD